MRCPEVKRSKVKVTGYQVHLRGYACRFDCLCILVGIIFRFFVNDSISRAIHHNTPAAHVEILRLEIGTRVQ